MAPEMDEDATAPDAVPVTDEGACAPDKTHSEDGTEDQEEGEISDNEDIAEEGKLDVESSEVSTREVNMEARTEVPMLKRIVSLDDLSGRGSIGSRGTDQFAKRDSRDSLGGDDDENVWLRDKVSFRPAASSYAPNLYNFAWAQAVQGLPGFKLVESPIEKDGEDEAEELDVELEEDETEWQRDLPDSMSEMSLKIPEGYDMRQRLYDRRLMRSASWNPTRGDLRTDRQWMEGEEDLEVRRRFDREERGGSRMVVISRRETRSPSRRRDGRTPVRRDDFQSEKERQRGIGRRDRDRGGERQRARDRDRERVSERGDRMESSHRPTSSTESGHSRGSAPLAGRGRQSQSDDNAVEVQEEGEIEEGEIELPALKLSSRSPSREKSEDPRADNLSDEGFSNGNIKRSLSSRLSFRNISSHSRSLSRESSFRRLQDDDLRHRLTRDAEREKSREENRVREERREQMAQVGSLMKNVTVKDAQKSFISTCLRLDKAMRLLEDLSKQRNASSGVSLDDLPRDVSKLATKVFQGLRAVYAVWNTASGREQDNDTFPRLLEVVNGSCLKLFTTKQARELREFMDQVTKAGRKSQMEAIVRQVQATSKPAEVLQENEIRLREPTANITSSISHTRGTALVVGPPEQRVTLDNNSDMKHATDEATIAAAALAYAQSSAAAFANSYPGSRSKPANEPPSSGQGYWDWNGSNEPYEQSMSPGLPPGYSGGARLSMALALLGQVDGVNNSQGGPANCFNRSTNKWMNGNKRALHNVKAPLGHGYLEEDWEEFSPPHANVSGYTTTAQKTVKLDDQSFSTSNPKSNTKLTALPMSANFRLPSPTPSEEDDDHDKQIADHPTAASEKTSLAQSFLLPVQNPLINPSVVARPFYTTLNTHVDESGRVHYLSAPLALPTPMDQDMSLNFEQPKVQADSGLGMANLRSRDPRRQLHNGYSEMEVSVQQSNVQSKYLWPTSSQAGNRKREVEDSSYVVEPSKRLKLSVPNDVITEPSAGAFAMGGWLEDGTVMSSSQENNGIQAMDVDLDSPTPADREHPMKHGSMVTVGVPCGRISSEMAASGTAAITMKKQSDNSLTNGALRLEEQAAEEAGDSWKLRMRPRDPRRFLLEIPVEKADGLKGSDSMKENIVAGAAPQFRKQSPSPAIAPLPQHQQFSRQISISIQDQREMPSNSNGMYSSSGATSSAKSLAVPANESKSLSLFPLSEELNENNKEKGNAGDSNLVSKDHGIVSGDSHAVGETLIAGPLDPSSRKPRFGPSHWGGDEMSLDLEQYLGTLDEVQRQAIQKERKRRMQEQDRMFSAGKLCLVLDLDHTLLNSAKFAEIESEWETRLRAAESMERNRANRDGTKQELYRFPHMGMWTKLRPGIWSFLAKASHLYELHVYTMGNKAYATEMAKLLDPTGSLFAERVISKGDEADVPDSDDRPPKSKDLDGVLGMESAVVIIDDSSRVWPHHRDNLIVVERYMYFPSSRRQFGLSGPSLLEVGHDERSADGMLSSTLGVIDRIHETFFRYKRLREVDVRSILAAEQRNVLSGCCVLFSRIFPVGEANPHGHPLWRMAEQFGASCCLNINDKVTHVVAISLGTDKVNWASATGRPVVRPAWLEASAILYRRANEQDFPVPP